MRGKILLLTLLLLAVLAAVLISFPGRGGEAASGSDSSHEKNSVADPAMSVGDLAGENRGDESKGLRGFPINARFGEERSDASQAVRDRLLEMQRRDDVGLEIVTMPDGHQSIDLKGRFQHVTSLVVAEDGSLVPVCGGYLPVEVSGE